LRLIPFFRYALISSALIAAVLFGVRAFYTYVVVAPYTKTPSVRRSSVSGFNSVEFLRCEPVGDPEG
jgi:hypothetical protein